MQVFGGYDFYVYEANITGNERVSSELIYQISGIDEKNVLWIQPERVRERIRRLPGIADAQVAIELPNHVRIEVNERQPAFVWKTAFNSVWIATDGEPMPSTGHPPELTLADTQGTAWSEAGHFRWHTFEDVIALHERYPELATLYYGPGEGLFYTAQEGWNVFLGEGQIPRKLALLEGLRPQITGRSKPTGWLTCVSAAKPTCDKAVKRCAYLDGKR